VLEMGATGKREGDSDKNFNDFAEQDSFGLLT
jgi:hypothetical protein